MVIFPGTYTDP